MISFLQNLKSKKCFRNSDSFMQLASAVKVSLSNYNLRVCDFLASDGNFTMNEIDDLRVPFSRYGRKIPRVRWISKNTHPELNFGNNDI